MFNARNLSSACIATIVFCSQHSVSAHQGHTNLRVAQAESKTPSEQSAESADSIALPSEQLPLSGPSVEAFRAFTSTVSTHVDGKHLIIESNGLPDHDMMVGIRAWQQQVPLPQPFVGDNAWRLPLDPRPASKPISVLAEPLRGAIALAVNGVPIFCALNNRAEDTYLAGELDQWGGHCGRGDDYHYHIAPVHLEAQVGIGNPIAFALDGYPILGLTEADGSEPVNLDPFNGHTHDGNYHYHATKTFPYVNGGLYGLVTMRGDQIEQPRDSPVRTGQQPLPGASVTGFLREGNQFDLQYEISGKEAHVKYKLLGDNRVEFTYINPSGETSTEVYRRSQPSSGSPRGVVGWWSVLLALSLFGVLLLIRRKYRQAAYANQS